MAQVKKKKVVSKSSGGLLGKAKKAMKTRTKVIDNQLKDALSRKKKKKT